MVVLSDVLEAGLKVVFCGTAAGEKSAQMGQYYAGRGNKFWSILHRTGLTPRQLQPSEFRTLPQYGIGLTDLAKHVFGMDVVLTKTDFDPAGFQTRIEQYAPLVVAFNGKRAAQEFYGRSTVSYGLQPEPIAASAVFVLPSTSGAANVFWDETHWFALATFLNEQKP
jgi:double-stranded uracil-DNA glycosylase